MADHELQCWSGGAHRSSASMPISVGVRRRPKQGLKCPRCDSPNTKFCYYNNYSLSQPRHFCKSCRRYWTEGGALRNVPVGGGCRKSKKFRSPAESRRHEIGLPPMIPRFNDHRPPASEPVLFSPAAMGFNYPLNINAAEACGSTVDENAINVSSIELLRSISQDLHWKLQTQKQKPVVLFGGEGTDHDGDQRDLIIYNSQTEPTPADEACGGSGSRNVQNSTAWFSECSNYAMLPSSTIVNISNTSSSDVNSTSYWNEAVPAWNDDKPAGFITPLP